MRIRRTGEFDEWLKKLRDPEARVRINVRIKRLGEGNPGNNRFLGEISELRIDYGPGYRVYYKTIADCQDTGKEVIIILCGGDKTTQQADIDRARDIARRSLEEEEK